jgi:2-hydroxychromene-2-carboxylate isomerase
MKSSKYLPPELSRSTDWSAERLAKLSLAELKALQANAERLDEPELAAQCVAQATVTRRAALAAPKPPGWKPRPRSRKKAVEEEA